MISKTMNKSFFKELHLIYIVVTFFSFIMLTILNISIGIPCLWWMYVALAGSLYSMIGVLTAMTWLIAKMID